MDILRPFIHMLQQDPKPLLKKSILISINRILKVDVVGAIHA